MVKATDDCSTCPTCTLRDGIMALLTEKYPSGDTNVPLLAMAGVQAFLLSAHAPEQQEAGIDNIVNSVRAALKWYGDNPDPDRGIKAISTH